MTVEWEHKKLASDTSLKQSDLKVIMATNDSLQLYLRLINQKHAALIAASAALFRALPTDDSNMKKSMATAMLQEANDLRAVIANADVPAWLTNTISYLANFVGDHWSAFDLLSNYVPIKTSLETHAWGFEEGTETAFDFDSIFEHFKKESRLPELFDQIVSILEDIQKSGEVDSVMMLSALGKVIATIKRCKDGSYFSLNGAWEFLLSFLNNYLWGELAKIPVLGTAMEALGKTIRETDEEMFKVHNQIKEEMARTVGAEVKALESKSTFPFITYNRAGHLLPGTSANQLADAMA